MKKKKQKAAQAVDVLSHSLVPEMKVISGAEKDRVLKKFGISEHQLPKILQSDPAAAALKASAGEVIRIDRQDSTGKYAAYRLVV